MRRMSARSSGLPTSQESIFRRMQFVMPFWHEDGLAHSRLPYRLATESHARSRSAIACSPNKKIPMDISVC